MARTVKNLKATEDQIVVDSQCILGALEAGRVQELTGTQAVSLLPAATASVDGKMTAAQAAELAFLLAGCFGGIRVHDATASQNIASGATYTKSTCYVDNDPASNCTADAANNKITLTRTGYYWVYCTISFTTATNNVVVRAAAFLDGVEQKGCRSKRKIGTGADVGNMSFGGIVDATSPNLDLDMRFVHDAAGAVDITVEESNLSVQWLGNT